jgi:processive 1,2-diacylglycerol beta-glucosyltransferase
MFKLYDEETKVFIGTITQKQLNFLIDQLEEEGLEDRDYAITPMTLSLFEGEGVDPVLVSMLRGALGDREEMSIYWEEAS